jgi:hypothetical protein
MEWAQDLGFVSELMSSIRSAQTTKSSATTVSAQDLAFGWEPWTAPALEELLPQLSLEEQQRVHNHLRDHKELRPSEHSEGYPRHTTSETVHGLVKTHP